MTLKVLDTGTRIDRARELALLLGRTRVSLRWQSGRLQVFLDNRDVSRAIRTPRVSAFVSEVSAVPAVRHRLVQEQRRLARGRRVVCEGRDIGSVVFPRADLKVYLDCDVRTRAGRRERELAGAGMPTGRRAVRTNLLKRDRIDSGRTVGPLRRVDDAVLVDTGLLTIEEQVAVVCDLVERRQVAAAQIP